MQGTRREKLIRKCLRCRRKLPKPSLAPYPLCDKCYEVADRELREISNIK